MPSSGTNHTIAIFRTSVYEKNSRRNYIYFLYQVWNLYNLKNGAYMHHTCFANLLRQVINLYKGNEISD
jgi:hypothetical protein